MVYEKHFVNGTLSFKIKNMDFEYRKKTCGDEARWIPHCMQNIPEGRVLNPALVNMWKCTNLIQVPWKAEDIKVAIGIRKEWNELSELEKFKVFEAMDPVLANDIINAISKAEEGDKKKI